MEILLTRPLSGKGRYGDKIKVADGYGKYLIRYHGALFATKDNLERIERERATLEAKLKEKEMKMKSIAEKISSLGMITIHKNANDSGHLYGAISPRDIVDILKSQDIFIDSSHVVRSEISKIGEHIATVKLGEFDASFKLMIERISIEDETSTLDNTH